MKIRAVYIVVLKTTVKNCLLFARIYITIDISLETKLYRGLDVRW